MQNTAKQCGGRMVIDIFPYFSLWRKKEKGEMLSCMIIPAPNFFSIFNAIHSFYLKKCIINQMILKDIGISFNCHIIHTIFLHAHSNNLLSHYYASRLMFQASLLDPNKPVELMDFTLQDVTHLSLGVNMDIKIFILIPQCSLIPTKGSWWLHLSHY